MRRLAVSVFILLLVLCDLSAFAQRRPAPPNRPPPVGPRGGGPSGVRPTIPRITRPPRSMDPARRQPIPRASSVKATIPPAKSPEVARARVEAKTKLDQLRSLRARLRSRTALSSGTVPVPKSPTTDQTKVQFGRVANQVSHAFRHTDKAGLNREAVKQAIQVDIAKIANSLPKGQYNGSVNINGIQVDYSAFKLADGTINVGRITPRRR